MNGYASYAFGKSGAFMAGWTYGLSLLIANIAIAITCVGYGSAFFEVTLSPVETCLYTIAILWICTLLTLVVRRLLVKSARLRSGALSFLCVLWVLLVGSTSAQPCT